MHIFQITKTEFKKASPSLFFLHFTIEKKKKESVKKENK